MSLGEEQTRMEGAPGRCANTRLGRHQDTDLPPSERPGGCGVTSGQGLTSLARKTAGGLSSHLNPLIAWCQSSIIPLGVMT